MKPIYEHRQFGAVMMAILLIPILGLCIPFLVTSQASMLPGLIVPLGFMLIIAFMFGSLTVKVDAEQVLLFFGPGFPSRSFPLEQIDEVRVVRNELWMGLGIHFIRGGTIYNVSGLDGVELSLRDGRLARIGTDEPVALARAIEDAKMESRWRKQ
jgi:hypothetical protein